jgi:hypothetical protein
MKQVLLLAIIHLLIFHQYSKDKKERLSPQQPKKQTDRNVIPVKQKYLMMGVKDYNDSLFYWHSSPALYTYYVYPPKLVQR